MKAEDHAAKLRASRIESLNHTPAWDELTVVLQEQEDKYWKRHISAMKAGKALDQREIDRAMGKLDGIRAILSAPGKAASILERANDEQETS